MKNDRLKSSAATNRFRFETTPIGGLVIAHESPKVDERGEFTRVYCATDFLCADLEEPICQINHSLSLKRGTIRGLHFQHHPYTEDKVVSCVAGEIFDVAVDLRRDSPTFLRWFGITLSAKNNTSLIIPAGFAHGFQALEDHSEVLYFVTAPFHAQSENGLNPMDPMLEIKWPLSCTCISQRDRERPFVDSTSFVGL